MRECSDYTINQVEAEKKTFNSAESAQIKDWVKLQPKQLKQVVQKIKKEWSINTSTETIKRIIKKKRDELA